MANRRAPNITVDDIDEITPTLIAQDPWPLEAFPDTVQQWVNAVCLHLGCHPVVFVLPLLATISGLIGTSGAVVWNGTVFALPIFVAVCAPSGSRKSAAFGMIYTALTNLQIVVNHHLFTQHEHQSPSRRTGTPPIQQIAFAGGTLNGLRNRITGQPDKKNSICMVYDELTSLLGWLGAGSNHDKSAVDIDIATLLTLFDGRQWHRELVNNRDVPPANDPADAAQQARPDGLVRPATGVSIATWGQPAVVVNNLCKPDYLGFWARWDVVMVGRRKLDNVSERQALNLGDVSLDAIVRRIYNAHSSAEEWTAYELDDEAAKEFHRLFQLVENELDSLNGGNEPEARVLGKTQGKILKYAAVLHVFLHCFQDAAVPFPTKIGASSVILADKLVRYANKNQRLCREQYAALRERKAAILQQERPAPTAGPAGAPRETGRFSMRAIDVQWRDPAKAMRIRGRILTARRLQQYGPKCASADAARKILQELAEYGLLTHDQASNRWIKVQLPTNLDNLATNQMRALNEMGIALNEYHELARETYSNQD